MPSLRSGLSVDGGQPTDIENYQKERIISEDISSLVCMANVYLKHGFIQARRLILYIQGSVQYQYSISLVWISGCRQVTMVQKKNWMRNKPILPK
jgi:hypothetical protein